MSRVGKKKIKVEDKVEIKLSDLGEVKVKGPKGELSWIVPNGIRVEQEDGFLQVSFNDSSNDKFLKSMYGTSRSLISNMVTGVSSGFTKELEIQGVGFRAALKGSSLELSLGFSHPVIVSIPDGLKVEISDNTKIKVEGIDKQLVGQFASDIRSYYPPEPYKGKGIRYKGEYVIRKQGKSVK